MSQLVRLRYFAGLILFLAIAGQSAWAQITVVQSPAASCTNVSSCTVVFPNAVLAGDSIFIATDFSGASFSSVLDSLNNHYTVLGTPLTSPDSSWQQVAAWTQSTASGSFSVAMNLTAQSPFMEIYAFDIRGGTLDTFASATGAAGTISAPVSASFAGETVVAVVISGAAASAGAGFTVGSNLDDNLSEWKLLPSAGVSSVTGTSSADWTMDAATFKSTAVTVAPSITTQPASQTVNAGQTATFSVVAAGTAPLSYQWQKNGTAISGATAASYTTPATSASDNGSTFLVVVSNAAGNMASAAATLTVNAAPTITTQPASQTVNAGQTATFSVVAAGAAPLSYQWQKNGTAISGATAASYTTPATSASDNGSTFLVVVSNAAGNMASAAATLTVNVAPTITTQPASQTVNAGQTATFSVVAAGTAPLSYQWRKNGTAISGATTASYTTPATSASDNGSTFLVVVSNAAGNMASAAATLTVNVAPTITTQPVSQTVNVGQTATFSVVATGTAPLSYQWQKNGTAISGATAASYTTPATSASDNGSTFLVVVSNAAGNMASAAATLTVNVAPTITTQPASQTVNAGQTATFSVVAAGAAPLSYQWQKNGTAISGATAASYTTPATSASDNGSTFLVVVSNAAGNMASAAA